MTNATGHGPDHAGHDHDHGGHGDEHAGHAGHGDEEKHGHDDEQKHGHDDEHGQVGGIRRRFGHGHGHGHGHHDAAVTDDLAMTTAAGIRASIIGLIGLLATALVQLALVGLTGSVALLSDTVHNLGDCLTALPIWLAFRLARRPPSARFTYGLGRVEDLAGLLVVFAIGASGVYAVFVSIERLLHPSPVEQPWIVVAAGLIGVIGNEAVARFRINAGKRIGSLALVADGEHARSDGLSSLAVVGSGLASLAGWAWADPIVGLVIAASSAPCRPDRRAILARLLDAVDPELVDRVRSAAAEPGGVITVDDVRVRWLGHRARAEIDVTVDSSLSVVEARAVADAVTNEIRQDSPEVKDVAVQILPALTH
jgi:cation diffusion facilitator family transporter